MTEPGSVGVTGHQARPGIEWDWVAGRVREALVERAPVARAFSSLAAGSDQVFASEALALGIPVTAVIPMPDYERCFEEGLERYRDLLSRCEALVLEGADSDQEAFMEAGRRVADASATLVAIWDGRPAEGHGGTADVVAHALGRGHAVVQIDPIGRTVRTLKPAKGHGEQNG